MGASLARRLVRHHKGIFLLVLAADSDPLNLQSESVQHASRLMRSPMIDVSMSRQTGLVQTCRDESGGNALEEKQVRTAGSVHLKSAPRQVSFYSRRIATRNWPLCIALHICMTLDLNL